MIFSKNGRTLVLLDESGSVTFFSCGTMPNNFESKFLIYNEKDFPDYLARFNNLILKIKEGTKPVFKRYK